MSAVIVQKENIFGHPLYISSIRIIVFCMQYACECILHDVHIFAVLCYNDFGSKDDTGALMLNSRDGATCSFGTSLPK
jgi:hypothetical protein